VKNLALKFKDNFKIKKCIYLIIRYLKCMTSNILTHGLFDHESKNTVNSSIYLE